ncbi:MAG: D-sedoheptulose 7-phosphate isomerase [Candidatus Altiarchaeota archaeon]|nr:D-sedoheptulose 7-phosphate isomerase [Candidatus Altiarchaeota archaeon]
MRDEIIAQLGESVRVKEALKSQAGEIEAAVSIILNAFKSGGKVLLCGNGGSAADCQHMAGEFVGRFKKERKALPAMALSTDTSILTALTNDYGGEIIFSRQVEAHGRKGDVLIAISTSGSSPNIMLAIDAAKSLGMKVIGLTGSKGEKMRKACDLCIMVPSSDTPRIQESHLAVEHIICGLVERELFKSITSP